MYQDPTQDKIDYFKIKLITFAVLLIFAGGEIGADAPDIIFYVATSEVCCGEDPHAVHGTETPDGNFVLAGKSIDSDGEWQGFAVKFPADLPSGTIWLDPEEKFTYKWSQRFGTDGNKDSVNGVATNENAVFVAGFISSHFGMIERYLAKLDLFNGSVIWEKTFPDKHANGESAFESIQLTDNGGIILSGFVGGQNGDLEGFKSYGNPQSGMAFIMYLNEKIISGSTEPQNPTWEKVYSHALSGKTVREITGNERGYVLASSTRDEKPQALVVRTDENGKLIWSKQYPEHGELTDITLLFNNSVLDGFALAGHVHMPDGGVDGVITRITPDGDVVWNKSYGNPVGGVGMFNGLEEGNKKLIFDECWSIEGLDDGGAVMACGTGIEECEPFQENSKLFEECEADPRKNWRSLLVRVNGNGDLIWQHVGSYRFPEENEEGEDEEVASSASEFVFITSKGEFASITDLAFGIGLQLLEKD